MRVWRTGVPAAPVWRWVYRIALVLALPVVIARLHWRGWKNPAYRLRRRERFGWSPEGIPDRAIWFHTVSAGETIAAAPLIREVSAAFPGTPVLVTTMTPTGSEAVGRLFGHDVAHCYAPYDFARSVSRFLARTRPRTLILLETELWPNLIEQSAQRGLPVMLVNARLSERSARGYRLIGGLTRSMLAHIDWIACQYADHAARFLELGADAARVEALGSIKFDIRLPNGLAEATEELRGRWGLTERPVWIAASTHAGEDEIVLRAHRMLSAALPELLLVLVPRHPERFQHAAHLSEQAGFATRRMTHADTRCDGVQVMVGDTMGKLMVLYGLARVAFVGGSLVHRGGHNPIEPAALGIPVVMGSHDFNFADVTARFEAAGCLHRARTVEELAAEVGALLKDPVRARREGAVAREVVEQNRGTTAKLVARFRAMMG